MPLTKEQFNKLAKQAANNYAKKLKLEPALNKQVNSIFTKIINDYDEHYSKHGAAIDLSSYQKDMEKILNDHGIKTASTFSNNLRDIIGEPTNNRAIQRKLDANIRGFAAQRSHLMSHKIIDTTRDNIEVATKDAEITAALSEEEMSNSEIAKIATNSLKSKLINRSPMIAATETQIAAETGKKLEYDTMINADANIDGEPIKEMTHRKVWITILDDHTREAHAEADAQEVGVDDPFIVDGEQLMIPGDDSMGASEGNLINCRCDAEFIVE